MLGIPRGGVPLAAEIARALEAPIAALVTRKLGVPGHEEFGFGAIGEGGVLVIDGDAVAQLGIAPAEIERIADRERVELERRVALYRGDGARLDLAHRTAILVDDGVAMGGTMLAAVAVAHALGAARVVVAVGAASAEGVSRLRAAADEVVAAVIPAAFRSVGEWYRDFSQVSDAEVLAALKCATQGRSTPKP